MGYPAIEAASHYLATAYSEVCGALEDDTPDVAGAAACAVLTRMVGDGLLWVELRDALPLVIDPEELADLTGFLELEVQLLEGFGLPSKRAWDLAQAAKLHLTATRREPGTLQLEMLRQELQRAAAAVCEAAEALRVEEERKTVQPSTRAWQVAAWLGKADKRLLQIARGFVCVGGCVLIVIDAAGMHHAPDGFWHKSIFSGAAMISGESD